MDTTNRTARLRRLLVVTGSVLRVFGGLSLLVLGGMLRFLALLLRVASPHRRRFMVNGASDASPRQEMTDGWQPNRSMIETSEAHERIAPSMTWHWNDESRPRR